MRVNDTAKTMDMEVVDTNYWLQAYLISYLLMSKNEDPVKVIIPKFPSFPHPRKSGVMIPIEWVEPGSPIAVEIAKDTSNVPDTTSVEEVEVVEDKPTPAPEDIIRQQQENNPPEKLSPAKAALQASRIPKMPPSGDIGTGHPDNLGSRDTRADRHIARDLIPEPGVDESREVDTKIDKKV